METPSFPRRIKPLNLLLIGSLLFGLWHFRVAIWNGLLMSGNPQAIVALLRSFDGYGLAMLAILMIAQIFLALIPGQALVVAAGYLYGAPTTIIVVAFSAVVGSQLAFWLTRRYGRPLANHLVSPKSLDYWDRTAGHLGPIFYFLTFLPPVFPSDLMCYVAGLGKVSARGFLAANVAGRLISTITYTLLGAFHFRPPLWFWISVGTGLVIILTSWRIYRKKNLRPPARDQSKV